MAEVVANGLRFFDPNHQSARGPFDYWRWELTRERAEWPEWAASPFADKPPRRVDGKNLRVSMVGHASFLIQAGGHNILLDPVWSERASPFTFIGPKPASMVSALTAIPSGKSCPGMTEPNGYFSRAWLSRIVQQGK